jgi:hypothetical protein
MRNDQKVFQTKVSITKFLRTKRAAPISCTALNESLPDQEEDNE